MDLFANEMSDGMILYDEYRDLVHMNDITRETLPAELLESFSSIEKIDEWGIKEFAYEINHMSKGYYMVVTFQAEVETVAELDRICRINQNVVRHLIVNLEEQ